MKILYQESDPEFRSYVSMVLETAFEAEVVEVNNDKEGITILEFEPADSFDLVIADFDNPPKDESLFFHLKKLIPNIPYVFLVDPKKNNDDTFKSTLAAHRLTIKINKPFKDTEFFPVVEELLNEYSECLGDEVGNTTAQDMLKEREDSHDSSPGKGEGHYTMEADWSLEKKKKESEMEADWSIEKKEYEKGAEETADWSLEKKEKESEMEADWAIEKKEYEKGAEETANWSLAKEGRGEEEADWAIEKKEYQSGEEEDADWSLAKEARGEEEQDWEYEKKGLYKGEEEELDYGLGGDETEGEVDQSEDDVIIERIPRPPSDWLKNKQEQIAKNSEVAEEPLKQGEFDEYEPIAIEKFFNFNDVCCDVYIKLSKSKYLKIINANDIYDQEQLTRYQSKGKTELYIKGTDAPEFYDYMEKTALARLSEHDDTIDDSFISQQLLALEHLHDKVKRVGVGEDIIEQTSRIVSSCLKSIESEKDLFEVLKKFIRKENYLYEHSMMNAYICNQVLKNMNWFNEITIQKITLACLFHDISLKDEYLAFIPSLDDPNHPLPESVKAEVKAHPIMSAELVNKMKNVVPDVDTIIQQHHERPDGKGFPKGLNATEVQPLACILIIAEDFTNFLYEADGEGLDLGPIKEEFKAVYSKGNFKKVLDAFLASF